MNELENQSPELIPPGALEAITRGEIDIQIATAHKFPRSLQQFKSRAVGLATLDEDTASSCIYSRPVGKENGKPKYAEGLSVRMAEIVGASYGNLRVGAMLIEQTPRQVKARGFAHDLETNFAASSEVIEATIKRDGSPYDERLRLVIAKAALAKARRDATFMVVPKALCKPVENECRKVALGDAETIALRRAAITHRLGKLGIDLARVWSALNIKGADEIGLDELATLTGLKTAMKDGDVKVDEAFPPLTEGSGDGTPKPSPPRFTQTPESPRQAPRKATPKEQLANLLTACHIEWAPFARWLGGNGFGEISALAQLTDEQLSQLVRTWPDIVGKIGK